MEFYNENEPLYIETEDSGIGLYVGLLQVREDITCQRYVTRQLHIMANSICQQEPVQWKICNTGI